MKNNYIRSSFFIPKEIALFLTQEAKKQKKNKGQIITKALQLLKKEKLKLEMEKYYADPKNCKIEKKMAEESFFISN